MDAVEAAIPLDEAEPLVVEMASWDGSSLMCRCQDGQTIDAVAHAGELSVPLLPEEVNSVERCFWPIELLLVRTFNMPLSDPKLLDGAILAQEIADLSGEDSGAFWLAWHAGKTDKGVSGVVFGLPQSTRQMISEDSAWQTCPQLLVDAWEHLTSFAGDLESCAVIDEDASGAFIGYRREGVWRGIRRINRNIGGENGLSDEELAKQIILSWQAMGLEATDPVTGRVGTALGNILMQEIGEWQVEIVDALPDRHQANLELASELPSVLNFRHGKWAIKSGWQGFKVWKRPLLLALGLMLIWSVVTTFNIYSMNRQADDYSSAVEAAFHRGLPNESVMLDPLAQLRQAGGSSGQSESGQQFLQQLQHVSELYQSGAWEMKELNFQNGKMQMSGVVKDIDSLNRMKEQLQQKSGQQVVISDTDLSGEKVSFRMKW